MKYILDTNILIGHIRESASYLKLKEKYAFFSMPNETFVSVVTLGEIFSLSMQLKWGEKKNLLISQFFEEVKYIEITDDEIIDAYAQIDAYSQGKHPTLNLPLGMTARNMGKNDLWIAATAHAIGADLVTTDKDFDHLDGIFLNVISG